MHRSVLLLLAAYVLALLGGFMLGAWYVAELSGRKAMVYAAAVKSEGGGTLVKIYAEVRPGSGRVLLTVEPKTELDTQESAEIAAHVAQELAGTPLLFHDIVFTIRAPTVIVGGPSAGAAMAVAAYAALTGRAPRKDVVVTGELLPDGSIGPVGGLAEKLEACAKSGVRVFLIPRGERYIRVPELVRRKYSPAPGVLVVRTETRYRTVDLVEEGRKMGVAVVEVSHIREVLPYFFSPGRAS
ncbi:TPA: hypothetical protein EYP13_04525 [Candidatus Micrarchaeota archaeon]|nr:hypothetical protein [Candidatus Micrarchaeota archaeon]